MNYMQAIKVLWKSLISNLTWLWEAPSAGDVHDAKEVFRDLAQDLFWTVSPPSQKDIASKIYEQKAVERIKSMEDWWAQLADKKEIRRAAMETQLTNLKEEYVEIQQMREQNIGKALQLSGFSVSITVLAVSLLDHVRRTGATIELLLFAAIIVYLTRTTLITYRLLAAAFTRNVRFSKPPDNVQTAEGTDEAKVLLSFDLSKDYLHCIEYNGMMLAVAVELRQILVRNSTVLGILLPAFMLVAYLQLK